MKNVHQRLLKHPIEAVRPWIEKAWSGTEGDIFPRDHIRSWRKNPADVPTSALLPGVTRFGHGPFEFTLREWDGHRWRVDFGQDGKTGWHGFDLVSRAGGTEITHTLEGELGLGFRLFVLPIHDWAVEAMFDRLEVALATGSVPRRTARRAGYAGMLMRLMAFVRGRSRRTLEPASQRSSESVAETAPAS